MVNCPNCGSTSIESDSAVGNAFCTACGTVVEENTIVSEITFGESSSGAAIVNGSFVAADATGARTSGPFRNQSSENSREQTIRKGRQRVAALANAMHLSERFVETGARYFTLAVNKNFIRGRRSQYVVATCLYIVCRMEKTPHMLIDFSDLLQINVFVLGSTFLQFVKALHIPGIPLIDPSLYISRFANLLDFGEDTQIIIRDATRLVSRMKRDWIDLGRRPAGICGACLIIAARMNNYRRSMAEVVHVVKVAETTLQQRLIDFSQTATAKLKVKDFEDVWLEKSENPPAFEREKKKQARAHGRKRKRSTKGESEESDSEVEERDAAEEQEDDEEAAVRTLATMRDDDTSDGVFKRPLPIPDRGKAFRPSLNSNGGDNQETATRNFAIDPSLEEPAQPAADTVQHAANDRAAEKLIEDELATVLDSEELQNLESEELARRAELAKTQPVEWDESLADVDDDEINNVMLNEQEVEIKTQVWMQNNFEYLAAQEQKRLKADTDRKHGIRTTTKKKRRTKPRDSTAPNLPQSPAESARQMLEERQFSKKINYDAFDKLFA